MRHQGGFFCFVKIITILSLIGSGFFCCGEISADQNTRNILISEIQIGGATAYDEFVELYNPTDKDIDLSKFSLKKKIKAGTVSNLVSSEKFNGIIHAYGFFLIAHQNYTATVNANLQYSGASYSITPNNTILLYDSDEKLLDKVGCGDAGDFETQAAGEPSYGKSLARKSDNGIMQDTGDNNADFEIKDSPNPQNSSSAVVVAPQPVEELENTATSTIPADQQATSTPQTDAGIATSTAESSLEILHVADKKYNFGDAVINEFVSDPDDGEVEWLELYNRTNKEIDLAGWRIEDGSKAKTNLSGVLPKYKVIEKPVGGLNNAGDILILYDTAGKIIDQVVYGNWNSGDVKNNAPAAGDPASSARKFDGYDSYNNANDFAVTIKPTKGSENIIQSENEISLEAKSKLDFSQDIFLTEIMPNPAGDDTEFEYIEIFNAGKRDVDLTGWSLSNEDNKKINLKKILPVAKIQAGAFLPVFRKNAKIVLHNDKGEVKLFQPFSEKPIQTVKYDNVQEGWSYNNDKADWIWSMIPTPGIANEIKAANRAPEADFSFNSPAIANVPIIFDSSDTEDADCDKLSYFWDFGDGFKNNLANPSHVYSKAGIYKVKLEASDGKSTGIKEKSVKVSGGEVVDVLDSTRVSPGGNGKTKEAVRDNVLIINEIFPNPDGEDTGKEWIEIKNQSVDMINLLNWRIENSNGKYKIENDAWIDSDNFYLLANMASSLALKNSDDAIMLYNDIDELADQVEYAGAMQGKTYARGANENWFWTSIETPAEENIITVAEAEEEIMSAALSAVGKTDNCIETTLEKVRELDLGSIVKIKGTVAVEPGILGAQIFYIVGSPGMQIYNYKKDFPELKIGDYIEIVGELSQTQGELRIKTQGKNAIKINERKPAPEALSVHCDQVDDEMSGYLIAVTGEITGKKSSTVYIDDGNDEIQVYIKKNTGISTKDLTVGRKASITGILSKTQTGARLMPRYPQDIVLLDSVSDSGPRVLGEIEQKQEWDLAERDKKAELLKYFLIIASGAVVVLSGLLIKANTGKM